MSRLRRVGVPIGFAEVPDFHVAVARAAHPELATRPLIVGGDPEKSGKVLAVSPELVASGVQPGMRVREAQAAAPDAGWVETDMAAAREVSGRLRATVRKHVVAVEAEGLAGFYFEAPPDRALALEWATALQAAAESATQMPLRVGMAPVRFAAKLAAESAGEGGRRVVSEDEFETFLAAQPLERFPGLGPKTFARLSELGVKDVPGLRALGRERLELLLGNHGLSLWLLASGEDPKPLRARRHPGTLSRERTIHRGAAATGAAADPDPGTDPAARLREATLALANALATGLLREGLSAQRIAIRLTLEGARTVTRSQSFSEPVTEAESIATAGLALLTRTGAGTERVEAPVRKVALVLAGLDVCGAEEHQLGLF